MLKELVELSSTKKRLTIEIPADAIEAEIQKALKNVQGKSRLPGFRPGKAPLSLVEKKFGKEVEGEVLEKIIQDSYTEAVKEANLKPVATPALEQSPEFKRNSPLSLTFAVEVRPKVETLQYEGVKVKDVPIEVSDDEIDNVLQNLAEEKATYESVDDAIATGDLVTIDYTVENSETSVKDAVLKVGNGPYPQEFIEGLVGKKKEEQCEIEATFPDDSPSPFAGKRPKFQIKIKEIKRRNIPSIDDEFAKDLGFEQLQVLRDRVRDSVLSSKTRDAERMKQMEILDTLLQSHTFEVPQTLLNGTVDGMIGEIRAMGKDKRDDAALEEEVRPKAERSVKASILLELIGEKEGITVSDEEVKEEILSTARRINMSPENIIKYHVARDGSLERFRQVLFEKKVLNFLLGKAIIEKGE